VSIPRRLVTFFWTVNVVAGCAAHRDAACPENHETAPVAQASTAPPERAESRNAVAPSAAPAANSVFPRAASPGPEVIDLFPEGVPDRLPNAPPEREDATHVYHVDTPTLTLFRPTQATHRRAAVIVCPGGGYMRLSVAKEGSAVTRFLNAHGITAFVLKYHVEPYRYPAALRDVLRAVRHVRANAERYGVDPAHVGVFGSSAGGHLAASAATLFDSPDGVTGAAIDTTSARPDFVALLYPVITMNGPSAHAGSRKALLGDRPTQRALTQNSVELHVTPNTPPTFLVHTAEDRSVPLENSLLFYQALRKAGVPAELHLYAQGPHGFGLRDDLGTTSAWPGLFVEWLAKGGLLGR
jgi:acetyl esterase/lipase